MDRLYYRFAHDFERRYINQGLNEDRTIEQTLDLGWEFLSVLPRTELKTQVEPNTLKSFCLNF